MRFNVLHINVQQCWLYLIRCRQVDFGEMVTIDYVLLAGEFADGEGTRFARMFRIEYQRTESDSWRQYVNRENKQVSNEIDRVVVVR